MATSTAYVLVKQYGYRYSFDGVTNVLPMSRTIEFSTIVQS